MSKLPALTDPGRCPACGWDTVRMSYGGLGLCHYTSRSICWPSHYAKPHMHRCCERCGCHWLEASLEPAKETADG